MDKISRLIRDITFGRVYGFPTLSDFNKIKDQVSIGVSDGYFTILEGQFIVEENELVDKGNNSRLIITLEEKLSRRYLGEFTDPLIFYKPTLEKPFPELVDINWGPQTSRPYQIQIPSLFVRYAA